MPTIATASAPTDDRFAQYDVMRKRAQQQGQQAKDQQGEAIKRRFASIGNLNSGAYVKAAGQQDQAADASTQEAVQNVDVQEQTEKNRLSDVKQQQDFAAGESEKGRIFNREMFDKDQDFKKTVFADESKFRGLNLALQQSDLQESKRANSLNAATSISGLSDEQLRALGGASKEWGNAGNQANIAAILQRYGY